MTRGPRRVLAIDIGGTKIKLLATGQTEPRKAPSGKTLTPSRLVGLVRKIARAWKYDAISIGFPGLVGRYGPTSEPGNLGSGWVGYDLVAAFERPIKIVNDAVMQALGSYEGGRMLFLGLGTGLGAAFIADKAIVPLEVSELPWRGDRVSLGDALSDVALARRGARVWRRVVLTVACKMMKAFDADYVVIGGGNAKRLRELPHGVQLGHNLTAFRGGFRLWGIDDVPELRPNAPPDCDGAPWRLVR